jgi:hypothetical protein
MGSRNLWNHHKHPLIRDCTGEKQWENIKNNLFHIIPRTSLISRTNILTYSYKHPQNHVIYWLVYDWTSFTSKFILITSLYMIKTHEISRNACKLGMH